MVKQRSSIHHPPSSFSRPRRGVIFIVALVVLMILTALLLVYAQRMRVEAITSATRLSQSQADGIEQGAEQWVLAQIEANVTSLSSTSSSASGTAVDVTTVPAMAIPVGTGYFWVIKADPTQDQQYAFGIVDESAKVNLNVITGLNLAALPNMTQQVVDSITTKTDAGGNVLDSYETVEQMMLVPYVDAKLLYGSDFNRDGVVDDDERTASGGLVTTDGATTDARGVFNYFTVYSTAVSTTGTTTTPPGQPPPVGQINVNTAPAAVLQCLPGLTQSDAATLVSARGANATTGSPTTDTSWVAKALTTSKAGAIARYITGKSYQYSADIVAVSGDGRAYKRVRIVVDARTQPAQIIYHKDLSSLGWPLATTVRDSLRLGSGVPADFTGTTNLQGGGTSR